MIDTGIIQAPNTNIIVIVIKMFAYLKHNDHKHFLPT